MDRKRRFIFDTIKYSIIVIALFFICQYFISSIFDNSVENYDFLYFGVMLIFMSFLFMPPTYLSYKYGLIHSFPWINSAWGGDYSWWIDEEIDTDAFWRILLLSIVAIIFLLVVGFAILLMFFFLI